MNPLNWPLKQRSPTKPWCEIACRWAQGFVPIRLPHRTVCWKTLSDTTSRYFEAMREAICIHIGQGGAMFSSFMYDLPYICAYMFVYKYVYIYICIWIILLLVDLNGMTLGNVWNISRPHFGYCIDENLCILSRLWLEDKQPLALAGSTGSVLILKRDTWCLAKSYS